MHLIKSTKVEIKELEITDVDNNGGIFIHFYGDDDTHINQIWLKDKEGHLLLEKLQSHYKKQKREV